MFTDPIQPFRPARVDNIPALTPAQSEIAEAIVVGLNRRGVRIAEHQLLPYLLDCVAERIADTGQQTRRPAILA